MSDNQHEKFEQRYDEQDVPWDTAIVPPEVVRVVAKLDAGRALDLGCGTGTTVRYLLEQGWYVDGIDFVQKAVAQARAKLDAFSSDRYAIYCHDVTRLDAIAALRSPYDLVIDIGCGHNLAADEAAQYVLDVASLMTIGGTWMLYAHQASAERASGLSPEFIADIFADDFELVWQELSDDTSLGIPSGWYRFERVTSS